MRVIRIILFLSLYVTTAQAGRIYDLLTSSLHSKESPQVRREHITRFMHSKHVSLTEHSNVLCDLSNSAEIMGILWRSEELDIIADELRVVIPHYEAKANKMFLREQIFGWIALIKDPVVQHNHAVSYMGRYRVSALLCSDWRSAVNYAWSNALLHLRVYNNLNGLLPYFSNDSNQERLCNNAIEFEKWLYSKWYHKYVQATSNALGQFSAAESYAPSDLGAGDTIMSAPKFIPALISPSSETETVELD